MYMGIELQSLPAVLLPASLPEWYPFCRLANAGWSGRSGRDPCWDSGGLPGGFSCMYGGRYGRCGARDNNQTGKRSISQVSF